jgi:lysophospholipase L1-like esterase
MVPEKTALTPGTPAADPGGQALLSPARRFPPLVLATVFLFAAGLRAFAAPEPELHVRSGLPHVAALAHAGSGELRVAYLGGSITAAGNGWRTLTTELLRARFPRLTVTEISAGLPGTGSNLGVCRLDYDVLRHRPDLLFVEFAVNDTGTPAGRIERTMEGIVRQTWRANPRIDICFVYTVSTPGLPDLQAGNFPPAARAMETVAAHYGIPSIHFGVEIAQRVTAGALVFKAPAAPDDPRTFSLDGVHPTAAGHRIYLRVIERTLPALLTAGSDSREALASPRDALTRSGPSQPHALPPPLHADNWEFATLRLLDPSLRHGDWQLLAPDDANLRGVTQALLPPTWRTAEPGARLEFDFTGRRFGLLGIAAPDSGEFRVTVDDRAPVTDTFFDSYVSPTFCRQREWFFPGELADGPHRVRVELLGTAIDKAAIKAKAGRPIVGDATPYQPHRLTLDGVLIIGSSRP